MHAVFLKAFCEIHASNAYRGGGGSTLWHERNRPSKYNDEVRVQIRKHAKHSLVLGTIMPAWCDFSGPLRL